MIFKRIKCPVCGKKVPFFWELFSLYSTTCKKCNSKLRGKLSVRFYNLISGIIMFAIFFTIRDYFASQIIALIVSAIPAQIVYWLLPRKIEVINDTARILL